MNERRTSESRRDASLLGPAALFALDVAVVVGVFLAASAALRGSIVPSSLYRDLLALVLVAWVAASVYSDKYRILLSPRLDARLQVIAWSAGFALFAVSLAVAFTRLTEVSRLFVVVVLGGAAAGDLVLSALAHRVRGELRLRAPAVAESRFSMILIRSAFGFGLLFSSVNVVTWLKTGSIQPYAYIEQILLVQLASWSLAALITRKFAARSETSVFYQLAPAIKAGTLSLMFAALVFFMFRLQELSRAILFGGLALTAALEFLLDAGRGVVMRRLPSRQTPVDPAGGPVEELAAAVQTHEPSAWAPDRSLAATLIESAGRRAAPRAVAEFIGLLTPASDGVSAARTEMIEIGADPDSFQVESVAAVVLMDEMNRRQGITEFIDALHSKLSPGGVLVGCVKPLDSTWRSLRNQMPKFLFTFVYPLHFVWHRLLPKLPLIGRARTVVGRWRVLSKAEMFGRLNYCGFSVVQEAVVGDYLVFLARRGPVPRERPEPSYGPLIKLRRVGHRGEIIDLYKFRTMHPYSEFLQRSLYEKHGLDASGKFVDDYRIPVWGEFLRRTWLDEVPQVINWLRGDLRLFGVRALSEQYFGLYPEDLQRLRVQLKPGVIPPYYADLPTGFEGVLESERRYLASRRQAPIRTDLSYLARAVRNILLRGARGS